MSGNSENKFHAQLSMKRDYYVKARVVANVGDRVAFDMSQFIKLYF